MTILRKLSIGLVDVSPSLFFLETNSTISEITSPGFLNNSVDAISKGDFIFAKYAGNTSSLLTVASEGGELVLVPPVEPGAGFSYVKTFWLAENGDDNNTGDNINSPFQTMAKIQQELMPSISLSFYKLNIPDAGDYVINNFTLPENVFLIIEGSGAKFQFDASVSNGFNVTQSSSGLYLDYLLLYASAFGSGKGINISNSQATVISNSKQIIADIYRSSGNLFLSSAILEGDVDAGTGPGRCICNVDFYAGNKFNEKLIYGNLGQDYYGDGSWNGVLLGATYPTINIFGPTPVTADLSWQNAQIIVNGSSPIVITLPQQSNVDFQQGAHFTVIQSTDTATFSFAVEGGDNLQQNLGSSTNAGDRADVNRSGNTWYAGYVTQATGGGAIDVISNLSGSGEGVYATQVGSEAQFKRIDSVDVNIEITSDANEIYIAAPNMVTSGSSIAGDAPIFENKVGTELNFNGLTAGTNITLDTSMSGEIIINAASGSGDVTDGANIGAGIGIFKDKTGTLLNFKSLIAGNFVTIDGTDPDQVVISGTGAASFDYDNTYFLASNGDDSFSGRSIDQPKQTINGLTGVINSISNPTANNVCYILDGATYDQAGIPVVIPTNMHLSIFGVSAAINSSSADIFSISAGANLTVDVFQMQTTPGFNIVNTIGSLAYFNVSCNDVVGNASNLFDGVCQLYCNRAFSGDIITTNSTIAGIRGIVLGQTGSITGNFENEYFTLPPITYSSPQTITMTNYFIGKTIVIDSALGSNYTMILPDKAFTYVAPGSYFYVFQENLDKLVFTTNGGAVLRSDKGTGNAYKTALPGAMIRVELAYNGNVSHWTISGQLIN